MAMTQKKRKVLERKMKEMLAKQYEMQKKAKVLRRQAEKDAERVNRQWNTVAELECEADDLNDEIEEIMEKLNGEGQ